MRYVLYLICEVVGVFVWSAYEFPLMALFCGVLAVHSIYMLLSGDAFREEFGGEEPSRTTPPSPPPSYRPSCARCSSYNHSTEQHDEITRASWR